MKKSLLAILFGLVLVLGACGGGDDAAEEPAEDDATTEEEATDDGAADEGAEEGTEEEAGDEGVTEGGTVDTAAAEEVYQANCSACHGADLSGGAGPELTAIGSKLSADEIANIIENGQGGMPPVNLEGDDLVNISNWLAEKK